jgi:hypothetical protein
LKSQALWVLDRKEESISENAGATKMMNALSEDNPQEEWALKEIIVQSLRAGLWVYQFLRMGHIRNF